jgi:hypothetical protein
MNSSPMDLSLRRASKRRNAIPFRNCPGFDVFHQVALVEEYGVRSALRATCILLYIDCQKAKRNPLYSKAATLMTVYFLVCRSISRFL